MDEQRAEQQVERVDLGDGGGRPDRADGAEGKGHRRGEQRPDAESLDDRAQRRQGGRHEDRRQDVEPERDRPDRDQLGEPAEDDVGRVAGRGATPSTCEIVCISPQSPNVTPGRSVRK